MTGIDESLTFTPVRIAVLAVSDTRTLETDTSGQTLADRLSSAGHQLADRALVADDIPALRTKVQNWIDDPQIDVVITTGGTGLTGRDVTVEADGGILHIHWREADDHVIMTGPVELESEGTI